MKQFKTTLQVAGALLFTSLASAQVMTEARISTAGDDEEYVEILGTPGQSTDGLMLLVVEGDPAGGTGGSGTLDRVHELSGTSFGANDEYFVVGSQETDTAFPNTVDRVLGQNLFENSSLTLYLVNVPDPALRSDITTVWMGTDITDPVGSLTTRIATDPGVTILDAIAFNDGDVGDMFYDSAPVLGPDGVFLPSGVLRDGGCPGDWCTDTFINFLTDGVPNPPFVDPTPGAVNPVTMCMTEASNGSCPTVIGAPYCTAAINATGVAGVLTAAGSLTVANNDLTLTASSLPTNTFGFFIVSPDQGLIMNPGGSQGDLCVVGSIGRYVGPGQIMNSGFAGEFSLALDLTTIPTPTGPVAAMAGDTFNFQTWYRDMTPAGATSNFTQGLEMAFN